MEPLAEAVRTQTQLTGIIVADVEHKIGLYADDIILTLSDPLTYHPTATALLQDFSSIFFYKLNSAKSQMLPIHLSPSIKRWLMNTSDFSWHRTRTSTLWVYA